MLFYIYPRQIKNISWIHPKSHSECYFFPNAKPENSLELDTSKRLGCNKAIEDIRRIQVNYYLERRTF
ncbi:MAG: hypothetical protein ACHBN1_34700 [Heteroscytonema crispum UTEX LB 1556]